MASPRDPRLDRALDLLLSAGVPISEGNITHEQWDALRELLPRIPLSHRGTEPFSHAFVLHVQ